MPPLNDGRQLGGTTTSTQAADHTTVESRAQKTVIQQAPVSWINDWARAARSVNATSSEQHQEQVALSYPKELVLVPLKTCKLPAGQFGEPEANEEKDFEKFPSEQLCEERAPRISDLNRKKCGYGREVDLDPTPTTKASTCGGSHLSILPFRPCLKSSDREAALVLPDGRICGSRTVYVPGLRDIDEPSRVSMSVLGLRRSSMTGSHRRSTLSTPIASTPTPRRMTPTISRTLGEERAAWAALLSTTGVPFDIGLLDDPYEYRSDWRRRM